MVVCEELTITRKTINLEEKPMKRAIHAPRGTQLTCRNWQIEAAYRMIQNNLDPQVAFDPDNLIVYGGRGRAARNWECFDAILAALVNLEPDETLLVQSGKPVAVFHTHTDAPRRAAGKQQHRPQVGHPGEFRQMGARGTDHVRADDRRELDLYRHPGHPAGYV